MTKHLTNKSEVHNVNIKLDKNKQREYDFRLYLDSKAEQGMNRKETILQLFENRDKGICVPEQSKEVSTNRNDKEIEVVDLVEPDINDFEDI